mmetsp:Transcript_3383/g.7348  ORF Transcript_3383/g.7348 Transcript_3383/m.7348 type:complete len:96 (+) Transcript_3383:773-1060(+)
MLMQMQMQTQMQIHMQMQPLRSPLSGKCLNGAAKAGTKRIEIMESLEAAQWKWAVTSLLLVLMYDQCASGAYIRESSEDRGPWYMKLLHYYHSAI